MSKFLLKHFGFTRPYRFERMLALFAVTALAIPVAFAALLLLNRGGDPSRGLSWGTPRSWYFIYLAVLLVACLLLTRWPRIVTCLLSLSALEIGLGLGSAALYMAHLTGGNSLLPDNYVRPLYGWHPLLQALPVPSIDGQPERLGVFINSEHLRGPERTAQQLQTSVVVALFGGSTTLDFTNRDGTSWPERLEAALGPGYAVINHGAPGYTTAEHLIQTAFYERAFGISPHCSIYYVGWNDLTNAHLQKLDPGYANYHMRGQIDFLAVRRVDHPAVSVSPVLKLLARFVVIALDTARPAGTPQGSSSQDSDPALEQIFLRNVGAISAINRQRGIVTVWIGQVMNQERITSDRMRGWLTFVKATELLPFVAHFNELLQKEVQSLGDAYVSVSPQEFHDSDFIDEGHFSASGSSKFADMVSPATRLLCHR